MRQLFFRVYELLSNGEIRLIGEAPTMRGAQRIKAQREQDRRCRRTREIFIHEDIRRVDKPVLEVCHAKSSKA